MAPGALSQSGRSNIPDAQPLACDGDCSLIAKTAKGLEPVVRATWLAGIPVYPSLCVAVTVLSV
jgi:hypothetical protein